MALLGLRRLNRKLKRLPVEMKAEIRRAVAAGADDIVGMARRLAPVKSGRLRNSITATFGNEDPPKYAAFRGRSAGASDPDLTVIITAGNAAVRYAHLVEFGASPHIIKSKRGRRMGRRGQFGYVVVHPGAPPQPFFFPSYRANRKRVRARISRAVNKAAKRVAGI